MQLFLHQVNGEVRVNRSNVNFAAVQFSELHTH